jgi:EAL domain-containing protein (putative c-di-GMP-specific phosphodiesterase class I)
MNIPHWFQRRRRESDETPPKPVRPAPDHARARAISAGQVQVHFQPQIAIATGNVVGVEALARWDGCEGPEQLFRRAAAAGLSERLSRQIQRSALRRVGAWGGALGELRVAINLLAADLERPGYERWLLDEIVAAGLSPERVTAEITESSLVADRPAAAARLAQLRAAGVRIAVDDFGTGFCSLAYLTSLPLDALKIDRGLVADIVGGSRDRIVVKAMIRLARELGLQVIIEGVETAAQLALINSWGCDLYQGFLGARAMDESELRRFVEGKVAA